jgi:dihydroorotate dehydrogenase electron transfer subunit
MPFDVEAAVVSNTRLSDDYNVLALDAPALAGAARPGQFVMVKAHAGTDPLLRRPFSIFQILRGSDAVPFGFTLLNKRIGRGTGLLFDAPPGMRLSCLGPLGRAFEPTEPPTEAWMVAGGVGLAPFATLAEALRDRGTSMRLFYGARRAEELYFVEYFASLGARVVLSTEDGSRGYAGRVTGPLEDALGRPSAAAARLYACGPTPMMRVVARLAERHSRPCQVSLEQVMGCGLGGCYSCVVRVRRDPAGTHFVRSCLDGPVFDASTIVWDELVH